MAHYQVLARKYRPQSFTEVLGQPAIVTTLKNAIKMGRLAHAYLFCGSRGTGKTTLARVFAKALNCHEPSPDGEPCCRCSSCKEIASGNSLDVLEIDGASHRGIDDIRQINETVGYSSSSGKYKIYIIDEVHMLTKEAFNALLKTLEEPPAKVLFIFATTEPHKVLPTILSRCQRFNLNRIPIGSIMDKLQRIANELHIEVEKEALHLLAQRADGGLRDAESLFDQIIAFHEGRITAETVASVLGIMPKSILFTLDAAGKEGRFAIAFEIAHQIFSQGKDISQFMESITEHFRTLLLIKIAGLEAPLLALSEADRPFYENSAKLYTQEQCLTILDFLIESQQQIRFQASPKIALEAILLRIIRTHQRLPIEFLVRRLNELEQIVAGNGSPSSSLPGPVHTAISEPKVALKNVGQESQGAPPSPAKPVFRASSDASIPTPIDLGIKTLQSVPAAIVAPPSPMKPAYQATAEDPTPSPADLGIKMPKAVPIAPAKTPTPHQQSIPSSEAKNQTSTHQPHRYDTLLQFAAVELEGTVKKTH